MNEKFMDFFITLAPTLLTSVTAFLMGRYNNFQNRPLDKMELAYNRVYYPVYRIMREDSIEISTVIEKTKKYFCKYEKYIDRSTTMIYKQLCECTAMEEQERIYSCLLYTSPSPRDRTRSRGLGDVYKRQIIYMIIVFI